MAAQGLTTFAAMAAFGLAHESEPVVHGFTGLEVTVEPEAAPAFTLEPELRRIHRTSPDPFLALTLDRSAADPLILKSADEPPDRDRPPAQRDRWFIPIGLDDAFSLPSSADPIEDDLDLDTWGRASVSVDRFRSGPTQLPIDGRLDMGTQVDLNPSARGEGDPHDRPLSEITVTSGLRLDLTGSWSAGLSLAWSERDYSTILVSDTDRFLRMDESWFLGLWAARDLSEHWDVRMGLGWCGNDPDRALRPELGVVKEYREFAVTIGSTLRF